MSDTAPRTAEEDAAAKAAFGAVVPPPESTGPAVTVTEDDLPHLDPDQPPPS